MRKKSDKLYYLRGVPIRIAIYPSFSILDFDGDGKPDIAVYRASTGARYIIPSSGAEPYAVGWGGNASDILLSSHITLTY